MHFLIYIYNILFKNIAYVTTLKRTLLMLTSSPLIRVVQNLGQKKSKLVSSVIFVLIIFGCHDSKSIQFFVQNLLLPTHILLWIKVCIETDSQKISNVNYISQILSLFLIQYIR